MSFLAQRPYFLKEKCPLLPKNVALRVRGRTTGYGNREFCGSFPREQRTSSQPKKTETVLSGFKSSDRRTSMKRNMVRTTLTVIAIASLYMTLAPAAHAADCSTGTCPFARLAPSLARLHAGRWAGERLTSLQLTGYRVRTCSSADRSTRRASLSSASSANRSSSSEVYNPSRVKLPFCDAIAPTVLPTK